MVLHPVIQELQIGGWVLRPLPTLLLLPLSSRIVVVIMLHVCHQDRDFVLDSLILESHPNFMLHYRYAIGHIIRAKSTKNGKRSFKSMQTVAQVEDL